MINRAESKTLRRAAFAAVVALALAPAALFARGDSQRRAPPVSLSFDSLGSFTPAGADPRLAASFASRAPAASDFRFTPAAAKGRPAQLRVAIRARAVAATSVKPGTAAASDSLTALTPATYNLGVALGWRRFAVSGDVAKVTSAGSPLGGRESAAMAISYNLKRFTGRVAVDADRGDGAQVPALTPATYNLGVALGWRRFAVSGDVAKVTSAGSPLGGRESAAMAISYNLKRFTGRVAVDADRGDGAQVPALTRNDNVAVDLGGAYSLTRNLAVTGGVRYKVEHDRASTLADQRRDSQAVYVGTAFKF